MRRVLRILVFALITAAIGGGSAALWHTRPLRSSVVTDAATIRAAVGTVEERGIAWQPPEPVDIASPMQRAFGAAIAHDGETLYFARPGVRGDLDIYAARRRAGGWSEPRAVGFCTDADELDPAVDATGQVYFASNRQGGLGGFDLWLVAPDGNDGWHEPRHLGSTVNSPWHEAGPTLEPGDEGAGLVFSSNRPRPGDATLGPDAWASELQDELADRDHDLYRAARVAGGFETAAALTHLNSPAQEIAPEVSGAGDFIYFASDRPGGAGDLDLYRAWRRAGADQAPMPLGPEVNTRGRETDPALALDGFQLLFASDRGTAGSRPEDEAAPAAAWAPGALYRTNAREVFRHTDVSRARIDWVALLPWIVWGLLLGLLAALLWGLLRTLRSEGFSRLGLMARCLLGSALVHMLVLLLMTFWGVGNSVADWARDGRGTRVAIVSPSVGSGIAEQVRGALTELAVVFEPDLAEQQEAALAEPLLLTATATIPLERSTAPEAATALLPAASEAATDAEALPAEVSEAAPAAVADASATSVDTPASPMRSTSTEAAAEAVAHAMQTTRSDAPALPVAVQASVALDAARAETVTRDTTLVERTDAQETTAETALATAAPQAAPPVDAPVSTRLPSVPQAATERVAEAQQFVVADADAVQRPEQIDTAGLSSAVAAGDAATDLAPIAVSPSAAAVVLTTLVTPDAAAAAAPVRAEISTPPTIDAPDAIRTDLALAALPAPPNPDARAAERTPRITGTVLPETARADAAPGSTVPTSAGENVVIDAPATRIDSATPLLAATSLEVEAPAPGRSGPEANTTRAPALPADATGALALELPRDSATPDGSSPDSIETEVLVAAAPARLSIRRDATAADGIPHDAPVTENEPLAAERIATAAPTASLAERASAIESAAPTPELDLPALELAIASADTTLLPALEENSSIANAYAVADEALELRADPIATDDARSDLPATTTDARSADTRSADVELALDTTLDPRATASPLVAADARADAEADVLPPVDLPAFALAVIPGADETTLVDFALDLPTEIAAPPNPYRQRAPEKREALVERMGGSEKTERAVTSALDWLARHQSMDGRWDSDGFDFECGECNSVARVDVDIALTGLSVLCFLATDNTHIKEGPYQENIAAALEFILERQRPGGDLIGRETLYSHGIATIALAEAYGMTGDPRLREPLERAIAFIIESRNLRVGGWRYAPGQVGDTSVLGWQIMAMKSARRAGIDVPDIGFETGRKWIRLVSSSKHRGRYAYQPNHSPTPAMTAESMFVNQLLGAAPHEPRQDASAAWITEHLPLWGDDANTYYWYYGTLALFQHQGPHWATWNERVKDELIGAQRQDGKLAGSWDPSDQWSRVGGRVYQTAICTLTLEVYYRYLPLYME